eukprot:TRINITY_DN5338_c0_g2_i9.p2 TRINITY_DN5338_c0_g2~~TRINITY_DN5338_c0_g2_i9.p2  ORF type:complete len:131 (+),score=58.23 TRINITY_DN5338_c0_g2_i9:634-1026(+)
MSKEKRIRDLECYVELLQEKMGLLEEENGRLKKQLKGKAYGEVAVAYEEMVEVYSGLSKEFVRLKQKESETFEKYVAACEVKEKTLVDTQLELSRLRMKVKLLEEVLTKRNTEYKELLTKYRKTVFLPAP